MVQFKIRETNKPPEHNKQTPRDRGLRIVSKQKSAIQELHNGSFVWGKNAGVVIAQKRKKNPSHILGMTRVRLSDMVRCAIWYQMLKNGILLVGQNAILTS